MKQRANNMCKWKVQQYTPGRSWLLPPGKQEKKLRINQLFHTDTGHHTIEVSPFTVDLVTISKALHVRIILKSALAQE